MAIAAQQIQTERFSFASSIAADVWHAKPNAEAFEWWYFDALSEDGRDAVVIIFLDNFIFSPRYNEHNRKRKKLSQKFKKFFSKSDEQTANLFPAIAFIYYRDGKPKYRAINEFAPAEFAASLDVPVCRIADNWFRLESAPYGSGYMLSINAKLRKNRHLKANFEWLSVESDYLPDKEIDFNVSFVCLGSFRRQTVRRNRRAFRVCFGQTRRRSSVASFIFVSGRLPGTPQRVEFRTGDKSLSD
jgi:hypothetical protein